MRNHVSNDAFDSDASITMIMYHHYRNIFFFIGCAIDGDDDDAYLFNSQVTVEAFSPMAPVREGSRRGATVSNSKSV